jgi:hypothetical protein
VIAIASLVDTNALGQVILYSLIAGVGITTVFSVAIVGLARFDEGRRNGGGRVGYLVLSIVCGLIVIATVVQAIVVMTSK